MVLGRKITRLVYCYLFANEFFYQFANNLIEKSPTIAAAAIIDPTIVFLDGEDHLQPPKTRESEEWVGINHNILWGNPMR